MIAVIAPAVNMQPHSVKNLSVTRPHFQKEALELGALLRTYDPWELESLLGVNPQLAMRAWEYYRDFDCAPEAPALPTFQGLAFQHMRPREFSPADMVFAGEHLRVFSAMYGVLSPCDAIRPYRLDFLCRFAREAVPGGLYGFWGDRVCREIFRQTDTVVHLSSAEYARLILPHLTSGERVIEVRFLVERRGKLCCPSTAAKMARGKMVRFLVENRITVPTGLQAFEGDGFAYSPFYSTEDCLTFLYS